MEFIFFSMKFKLFPNIEAQDFHMLLSTVGQKSNLHFAEYLSL